MRGWVAKGMYFLVLTLSFFPLFRQSVLSAQEPVKAHVMGDPLPGRDAPAFSLPYVAADGPGPADQPFRIRAELGRVVVLAFVPVADDSAATALVGALNSQDSVSAVDVTVAFLAPVALTRLDGAARSAGGRIKWLPDSAQAVRRLYGVTRGSIAVYVIDPMGRVSWRDLNVNPYSKAGYTKIRDAVVKAGRKS